MEQERKLREEQEKRVAAMFAYMQGLGASINYQPPPTMSWPPPPAPPPQMLGAPMVFPKLNIDLILYVILFAESIGSGIE